MRALPSNQFTQELGQRLAWVRAAKRQGGAVTRILGNAGVLEALRPRAVAGFVRAVRRAVPGPHLAITLHAHLRPDAPAIQDPRRALTYGEFEREVNQLAHALVGMGVNPGDRVAMMLPNCLEFIVILSALPRIGATAVQIGYRLKAAEIAHILENSSPRVILHHASFTGEIAGALRLVDIPAPALVAIGERGGNGAAATARSYPDVVRGQPGDAAPPRRSVESGGFIIYTSGTTGKPKGARRRYSQTGLESVADFITSIGMTYADRHLVVCPLYHAAAAALALMMLTLGASLVIPDRFDVDEVLALIERERITSTLMVPTMLVRLTQVDPAVRARYDTSSLRYVLSGAAPLATETVRRFQEIYGPIVWNFYGATETGLVTLAGPHDHTAYPGTVGRVLAGNELRVLDEEGRELPANAIGELYVRNSMLISGYHNDDTATHGAMRDGFFSVGDLARIDEVGQVYIASRVHDMVISGGVNIYPAEIEDHLHRHPEVLEAAVVGVPDAEWGEHLKAFIVVRPGSHLSQEDVVQFCRDGLADFKRPREVVFVEALPRNPTGKVLKRELRAM